MKILHTVLLLLIIMCIGCNKHIESDQPLKIEVSNGPNPWTNLDFYNDGDNFQFAIVSDRTGGLVPGLYEMTVEKVNLLMPEFVMCVGDLIEGKTTDENVLEEQWDELDAIVDNLRMPFFYLPGNHDIGNEVMADFWKGRHGRSYYHFIYKDVLFLCFNSEDIKKNNFSDAQIQYFKDAIESNTDVRWTVVFMHKPMWLFADKDTTGTHPYTQIEKILGNRSYTVFGGHKHRYAKSVRNGRNFYLLATNKDGIQNIDNCRLDHIVWVTMTDEGPEVANLLIEGILDDEPCPKESQVGFESQKSNY